jgi:hypothetical protein
MGREQSGIAGMHAVAAEGLAGATVDARTAQMGSGLSSYRDGVISAVNYLGAACGVAVGMSAAEAARLLVRRQI